MRRTIAMNGHNSDNETHRKAAEGNQEKTYRGFPRMIAEQKDFNGKSEALAPECEGIDERFFQPGTETAFSRFGGFGVVDLECIFGNHFH